MCQKHIKNLCVILIIAATFGLVSGCAEKQPIEFSRIENIRPSSASGIGSIRYDSLKQIARSTGAQTGLAWRSKQINKILEEQQHHLDHIFDFNYLILNKNVLPPVLAEGDNTLNLDSDEAIRLADRDYQIVSYPRFITAPPTWRNYLSMAYREPELPSSSLLPRNHKELCVWNQFVKIGWNDGVEQANQIFDANLNRLRRDYNGMVLYRKLLAQNMISAPFVSKADLGVTGDGRVLRINDRVLRITATSNLKVNSKVWRPAFAIKKRAADDVDNIDGLTSISDKYKSTIGNKVGGAYNK